MNACLRVKEEVPLGDDEIRMIASNLDTRDWTLQFRNPIVERVYVEAVNRDRRPVYFILWAGVLSEAAWLIMPFSQSPYLWHRVMSFLQPGIMFLITLTYTVFLFFPESTVSRKSLSRLNEMTMLTAGLTSLLSFSLLSGSLIPNCYATRGDYHACVRMFDNSIVLTCFAIVPVAPRIIFMLPVYVLTLFTFILGHYVLSDTHHWRPGTALPQIQIFLMAMVLVSSVMMVSLREKMLRSQFRADISQRDAALRVIKSTVEVDGVISWLLPASAMSKLLDGDKVLDSGKATVMFADLADFTAWCSNRTATQVTLMLNDVVGAIDALSLQCNVTKVMTIGDCYWTVCGVPDPYEDHARRTLELAAQIHTTLQELCEEHPEWGNLLFRIGLHTGQVIGAVLGATRWAYEVYGIICTVAQELEEAAPHGQVMISGATARSVGLSVLKPFIQEEHVASTSMGPVNVYLLDRLPAQLPLQVPHHVAAIYGGGRQGVVRDFRERYQLGGSGSKESTPRNTHRPTATLRMGSVVGLSVGETMEQADRFRTANCVWQTFADKNLEDKYFTECLRTNYREGLTASGILVTFLWFSMVANAMLSEDQHHNFALTITFAASALIVTGLMLVNIAEGVLDNTRTGIIFLIVFPSTMLVGALSSTSHLTWQGGRAQFYAMVTVYSGLSDSSVGCTLIAIYCFLWVVAFFTGKLVMGDALYLFSLLVFLLCSYGRELVKRREFVALTLADESLQAVQQEMEALESVIRKMLPAFVIPDLMQQYKSDVRSPLTFELDNVVVFFCKFSWGAQAEYAATLMTQNSPTSPRPVSAGRFGQPQPLAAEEEELQAERQWTENYDDNEDYVRVCGMLSDSVDSLLPQPDEQTGSHTFEDMTRVKTIGDVVMVAGPLDPTSQHGRRSRKCPKLCRRMLLFALSLRKVVSYSLHTDKVVATMGMHIGPVTAAVIGQQQLIYDIFGPTVNVASRVMTTNKRPGQIAMSSDFFTHISELPELRIPGANIGPEETCRAKGVGELGKHQVIHDQMIIAQQEEYEVRLKREQSRIRQNQQQQKEQ